jgi:putative DNA methylase
MLDGLLKATFTITGTWPMRTEMKTRQVAMGTNALASSIVLVCRPRSADAPLTTRREFVAALRRDLPDALKKLQHGNVAPVDLAQATIGPGMAVFSRYSMVLEAGGSPMSVRTALQIINQELDRYLAEQEGELDPDTRFCVAWFEQFGMKEGPFGAADVLARAKVTAVEGLVDAGVVSARAGKVCLLRRDEMPADWDPRRDRRVTDWECVQHLIRRLHAEGEDEAARLLTFLGGSRAEAARTLAYRLYTICERKGWAEEALAYNTLVVSWPRLVELAGSGQPAPVQGQLFQ